MKYGLTLTFCMWATAAAAGAFLQTGATTIGTARVRIQVPGDPSLLSGVTITMVPAPHALSRWSLPQTDSAYLAYSQSPRAVQAVTVTARTLMNSAEARQKLAAAVQQALPQGASVLDAGGGVMSPLLTRQTPPRYSEEGRMNRIQGTVEMVAILRDDGTVAAAEVTKSIGYGLDESAIAAVRQWQFKPATKDGKPTFAYFTISLGFNPPGPLGRSGITNKEGVVTLSEVPAGTYVIRANREGFVGVAAAIVDFSSGKDLTVVLKPASTFSGRVTDSKGSPITGARVALGVQAVQGGNAVFLPSNQTTTDPGGEYRFAGVAAGRYVLRVQRQQPTQSEIYYPGTSSPAQASELSVEAGQEVIGIEVVFP